MINETKTGIVTHMSDSRTQTYIQLDNHGDYYFFHKSNQLYRNIMNHSFFNSKKITIEIDKQFCISKMEVIEF